VGSPIKGNTLTDYGYDAFTGRKTLEIDAHGNETRFAYNDRGQVTHTWGTGTYPVKYVYDETGLPPASQWEQPIPPDTVMIPGDGWIPFPGRSMGLCTICSTPVLTILI